MGHGPLGVRLHHVRSLVQEDGGIEIGPALNHSLAGKIALGQLIKTLRVTPFFARVCNSTC